MSECTIHDYTKWTDISTRNKNWMGRYEFDFNYFWTNIKSFVFETCKNRIWFGQTIKKKIPGIGLLKLLLIPIKMYSLILQSKHFSFTVHILLYTGTWKTTFILPHGILVKFNPTDWDTKKPRWPKEFIQKFQTSLSQVEVLIDVTGFIVIMFAKNYLVKWGASF